jgi:hypothetical protein
MARIIDEAFTPSISTAAIISLVDTGEVWSEI